MGANESSLSAPSAASAEQNYPKECPMHNEKKTRQPQECPMNEELQGNQFIPSECPMHQKNENINPTNMVDLLEICLYSKDNVLSTLMEHGNFVPAATLIFQNKLIKLYHIWHNKSCGSSQILKYWFGFAP